MGPALSTILTFPTGLFPLSLDSISWIDYLRAELRVNGTNRTLSMGWNLWGRDFGLLNLPKFWCGSVGDLGFFLNHVCLPISLLALLLVSVVLAGLLTNPCPSDSNFHIFAYPFEADSKILTLKFREYPPCLSSVM